MKFQLTTALFICIIVKGYYGQYPSILDYLDVGGSYSYPDYTGGYPYYQQMGLSQTNTAELRRRFAENARSKIGWDTYTWAGKYSIGKKKDKCHLFVGDVLEESGAVAPQKLGMFSFRSSHVNAKQWENKASMLIILTGHFMKCKGPPSAGDILACDDHVGIVTGYKKVTMADPEANPRGLINETDWGFRKGQKYTCWRYK